MVINNSLVLHKLSKIRNKNTNINEFNKEIEDLSALLCFESLKKIELDKYSICTPIKNTTGYKIKNDIVILPILRAGLSMVEPFKKMIDDVTICFLGIKRDEKTLKPTVYYDSLPSSLENKTIIVLDPMLATGGSLTYAIDLVKSKNPKQVLYCGIVASKYGYELITNKYKDVLVYTLAIDDELTQNGFITPGLGDCGDRAFGKKE